MIYETGVAWNAEADLCRAEGLKRSKKDKKLRVCLLKFPLKWYRKVNILTDGDILFRKSTSFSQEYMFCYHGDNTLQFKNIYVNYTLCSDKQVNFTCITKDWIENYKMKLVKGSDYCSADMVPLKSRPTVTSTTATTTSTRTQSTNTQSSTLTSLITSLAPSFSISFSSSDSSSVFNSSSYLSFTSSSFASFSSPSSSTDSIVSSSSSSSSSTSYSNPTSVSSASQSSVSSSPPSTSSSSTSTSSPLSVPPSTSSYSFSSSFSYPSSLWSSWSTLSSSYDDAVTQEGTSSVEADPVVTSKVTEAGGTSNAEGRPITTVPTTPNLCWCRCSQTPRNLTQEELEMKLHQISSELSIPRKNTSKYIRSKISMEDKRASSFYMGSALVLIITIPFGLIILMDLFPLFKWAYGYLI
ncbi:uncharacterized protein DDB_G0271670-like [Octopus sinensis]|uniref:Uncharacterized protein DDB_G0271670-like n=1 Tax=Octopus sinensis TaxID=2607531 RepID=A0A7E6FCM5_9MOLL|nr:uncharacterized protein DDB_G0271670-like [Octopus sinensis]